MAWTKEERQEYDHHYYLAHREKRLAQNKAWRESNKEHVSEYSHKRYLMNREKKLAYQKEHLRKKKEKEKMKNEKVINVGSTLTVKDKNGRKLLVKIMAEVVDPETHEHIGLADVATFSDITVTGPEAHLVDMQIAMREARNCLAKYILLRDDH